VLDAVMLLARTASYNGDIADAVQRLQRIVPSFGRFRGAWLNHAGLSLYAHLLFQTGEWKAAQAAAQRAVDSALDASFTGALRTAYGASGLVAAARGDAAAVARVERLLGLVPLVDLGTSAYVPDLADIMRAELAAALDDPAAQLAATSAALAARRAGSVWSWLQLHVEALVRAGRVDDARTIAAQALGGATPWMRTPCNVARLEAYLASVRGDARQAVERYTALVRSPFGAPLPFERARDRVAFARALALVGRDDAALEQLALALPVFERLKTPNYIERARALEAELLARRPVPITAPAAPASAATDPLAALTDREREVALAVGRGLTNREVAAQLFVSVTTVNFHVRNILAKLSLSSRRELRPLTAPHDSGVR
jgi:DNA-binding CsgD family transcriptional regulator